MPDVLTEDDYLFLPEDQVAAPPEGTFFQCYRDAWWLVRPGKGLVFYNPLIRGGAAAGARRHNWYGRPQCNTDERVARNAVLRPPFPVEVRQYPVVFAPVNIDDYRNG